MNVSESIRVLLYPVSGYNSRDNAEHIENNCYNVNELDMVLPPDVLLFNLTDFMAACNNREINLESYWVSYICLIDEMEEHNRNIDTVIKSCEEGRDGDWDVSTNEGLEGFNDMITLLERCLLK